MTLSRWKILACTLTVGVGGLAVFATPPLVDKNEAPKEPAPLPTLTTKPPAPPSADDTPAPVKPVNADAFDIDLPVVPAKAEEVKSKPSSEPVFEPVTPVPPQLLPVKGEEIKAPPTPVETKPPTIVIPVVGRAPDAAKQTSPPPLIDLETPPAPAPTKPTTPAPTTKPETIPPPAIDLDIPVAPPNKPTPPATPPISPPAPPAAAPGTEVILPPIAESPKVPMRSEPVPSTPVAPISPPTGPGPKAIDPMITITPETPTATIPDRTPTRATPSGVTPTKGTDAKLKLLLRVGDGQPRFEIRNTANSDLLLKVYGEKVEMQAPNDARSSLAGVTAIGRVRFTAPGIEGTCDHLTILSATGEVLMKGNIRMKTKHGKSWSEMTAEKMVYQIGTNGLASSESRPPVRPASYIPD